MEKIKLMNKKKLILLVLAILFIVSIVFYSSIYTNASNMRSGTCGKNATWTLNDEGVLIISGTGKMEDYNFIYSYAPWHNYYINKVIISKGITQIGDYAFWECAMESVQIPNTVKKIGSDAFDDCSNLKMVNFPDSITTIGFASFRSCNSLTEVHISENVTCIDSDAFTDCMSLNNIFVDKKNKNYSALDGILMNKSQNTLICCPAARSGVFTIPNGVTTIDIGGFYNCSLLTEINIPNSITKIESRAFTGCTGLTEISLPNKLTCLGSFVFECCKNLKSIVIPKGVPLLYDGVFSGCSNLEQVSLPQGITKIGSGVFEYCDKLRKIDIPDSVIEIGDLAFSENTKVNFSPSSNLVKLEDGSYAVMSVVTIKGTNKYKMAFEILDLVNKERKKAGVSSLKMDKELLDAAMKRAAECSLYFSHTRPSGLSCFTMNSKLAGENIGAGYSSANDAMRAWMNSEGHKENILSTDYKSIGIGCFTQGNNLYWVQCFGTNIATPVLEQADKSASIKVKATTDKLEAKNLMIYNDNTTLKVGQNITLKIGLTNQNFAEICKLKASDFTWSSNNTSIATISSDGVLKTIKEGSFIITATLKTAPNSKVKYKGTVLARYKAPKINSVTSMDYNKLKVSWKKVSGASGYYVYRKNGSSWDKIATIKSNFYIDKTLITGKKYIYTVQAYGVIKGKTYTSEYAASRSGKPVLNKPVLKIFQKSKTSIQLSWKKISGASGYVIERKITTGNWKNIKTILKGSSVNYKNSKLSKNKKYSYRIRAYRMIKGKKVYSNYSNVVNLYL